MVLSGWKEIAQYLRCGMRTVQRWEAAGLPIHRPMPGRRSHVIAHSEDLDRWIRTGSVPGCAYPSLQAALTTAQKLRAENKVRIAELRERVLRLRAGIADLRALRRRNVIAGPIEVEELAARLSPSGERCQDQKTFSFAALKNLEIHNRGDGFKVHDGAANTKETAAVAQ